MSTHQAVLTREQAIAESDEAERRSHDSRFAAAFRAAQRHLASAYDKLRAGELTAEEIGAELNAGGRFAALVNAMTSMMSARAHSSGCWQAIDQAREGIRIIRPGRWF